MENVVADAASSEMNDVTLSAGVNARRITASEASSASGSASTSRRARCSAKYAEAALAGSSLSAAASPAS